jgi:murein DD-endopeptidase MepM/ murein hydrolase activator NlpD
VANRLLGGFSYLAVTADLVTHHPGVDLNGGAGGDTDCGAAVVAAVRGQVAAVVLWDGVSTGFGNHVWVALDDADPAGDPRTFGDVPSYAHYCHLSEVSVREGDAVGLDTRIGACGKTGGWPLCHLHFEIMRHPPPGLAFWPKGESPAFVQRHYHSPLAYLAEYQARPPGMAPGGLPPFAPRPPDVPAGPPPLLAAPPPPALTVEAVLDALRFANWQKHEMEAYIRDPAHRERVDAAAAQEGNPPINLMLRWARDHYEAGELAP